MLAMSCPSCGAPVPLSVEGTTWVCPACSSEGDLPGEVAGRLAAAAEVLRSHDRTERQLRGAARGAVTRGSMGQSLFGILVFVVMAPIALYAALLALRLVTSNGAELALACGQLVGLVPLAMVAGLAVLLALWTMRRARRRVALAAAAVPPSRPGGQAGCHVCGGPLEAGLTGVARCSYCGADNVVDAAIVSEAAAHRRVELTDYAAAVRSESGAVNRAFGCSTLLFLGVVVIAPFTCVIPMSTLVFSTWAVGMVLWLAAMSTQPPTPGNRYGLVDTERGQCVAWYNPYNERWERHRLHYADHGDIVVTDVDEVSLDALIGRDLVLVFEDRRDTGIHGIAERPHWGSYLHRDGRTLNGPDFVDLRQEKKRRVSAALWDTCIVE